MSTVGHVLSHININIYYLHLILHLQVFHYFNVWKLICSRLYPIAGELIC